MSFVALVHDLAESIVGDITPYCGVSKEEKKMREMNAMQEIAEMIAPRGQRLMELFEVMTKQNEMLSTTFCCIIIALALAIPTAWITKKSIL